MGYLQRVSSSLRTLHQHCCEAKLLTHATRRAVLPKSKTESRIKSNLEGDFKLNEEDIKAIDALDKKMRFNDPSTNFKWNFYADLDGKE